MVCGTPPPLLLHQDPLPLGALLCRHPLCRAEFTSTTHVFVLPFSDQYQGVEERFARGERKMWGVGGEKRVMTE